MTANEREYIISLFKSYHDSISKTGDYSKESLIPTTLIILYYFNIDQLDMGTISDNYRRKYLLNENSVEQVHTKEERLGLRSVYDYIASDKWEKFRYIYVILQMHELLFSKMPYPNGGHFKQANNIITNSNIETADYLSVPKLINELNAEYVNLLNKRNNIKTNSELFEYINRAIDLKCKLIEIHPFSNGNGRICRALLNILFRNISLPPVYIRKNEKESYIKAMNEAIDQNNPQALRQFYYYKICDSIAELDIKHNVNKEHVRTRKK